PAEAGVEPGGFDLGASGLELDAATGEREVALEEPELAERERPEPPGERLLVVGLLPLPHARRQRREPVLETGKARLGAECLEVVQDLPQISGEPLAAFPVGVEVGAPALGGRRGRRRRARGEREGEGDEGSPVTHLSAGSPQKTGSGVSRTPNRSRTRAWSFAAKATMSRACAPSCATTASVWRVERPAGPS